jgi:hypothetical protein
MTFVLSLTQALTIAPTAQAKSKPDFFSRIDKKFITLKNYDELMKLSRSERTAYIDSVRALVIQLETMQARKAKMLGDARQFDRMNAYLRVLDLMSATAEAQVAKALKKNAVLSTDFTCGKGYKVYQTTKPTPGRDESRFLCLIDAPKRPETCPAGFEGVLQIEGGKFDCASSSSMDMQISSVSEALRKPVAGATKAQQEALRGKMLTVESVQTIETKTIPKPSGPIPESEKLAVLPKELKQVPTKTYSANPVAAKPAQAKIDSVAVTGPPTNPATIPPTSPSTAAAPAEQKCVIPEKTAESCSDKVVRAAHDKYYSLARKDCIYAGNLTSYISGVKSPGRCEAPTGFCVESADCKGKDGAALTPVFHCEAPTEVICNPLVYGVRKDSGSAFCIARSAKATEACTSESSAATRDSDFLSKNIPGLKEAWNSFGKQLNDMCGADPVAAQFFCEECDLIKRRLLEIGFGSVDQKTCGLAKFFDADQLKTDTKTGANAGSAADGPPAVTVKPITKTPAAQ